MDVESTDIARSGDAGAFAAGDADNDYISPNRWSRGWSVAQRRHFGIEFATEVADAAIAEFLVKSTSLCIQREQPAVGRAVDDASLSLRLAVGPIRAAAIDAAGRWFVGVG